MALEQFQKLSDEKMEQIMKKIEELKKKPKTSDKTELEKRELEKKNLMSQYTA